MFSPKVKSSYPLKYNELTEQTVSTSRPHTNQYSSKIGKNLNYVDPNTII